MSLELVEIKDIKHLSSLIGVDEVGRGPLAGPVVAASARIEIENPKSFRNRIQQFIQMGVTDSKKLSDKKREAIVSQLEIDLHDKQVVLKSAKFIGLSFTIEEIQADEIDKINILNASLLAMQRSVDRHLDFNTTVWVDGNRPFKSGHYTQRTIVKGDSKSTLIGLASIVAKVYRDSLMKEYHQIYPNYFFEKNAGYPTSEHLAALVKYGPTPIHRRSFKGVLN